MDNPNKTQPTIKISFYFGLFEVDASGTVTVYAAVAAYGMILICKCFGLV